MLIFVHELGHYLVAIRNGIKAEEFGFGFPPRMFGIFKSKEGKYKFIWGNRDLKTKNTIFSLNWVPLGGFVKIKGEDGENKDNDSFASKSAWVRIKVLSAGVIMNFLLAWFLLAIVFTQGVPQSVEDNIADANAKVQISQVIPDSPAGQSGLKTGDVIVALKSGNAEEYISKTKQAQNFINGNKGREIEMQIKRGDEYLNVSITPRLNPPKGEGALGVGLVRVVVKKYSWYEAVGGSLLAVLTLTKLIVVTLFSILGNLITGTKQTVDIAGPVGIAFMTKQVVAMGWVYLLQFTAMLSINLAIINAFPFPALDGGRILFILIEKIKGSPVSQKVEQIFHTVGFGLLILLMIFVTFRDFIHFEVIGKIMKLF